AVEIRVPHLRTGQTAVMVELSDEFQPEVGELVPWRCAIGALFYALQQPPLVCVQLSERELASFKINVTVMHP
ncbi:MAG: hypothetical protein MN733_33020, partial [Nitrososphaera sp.]|nr:hypothetical protein [Nitrososphaera sp.]